MTGIALVGAGAFGEKHLDGLKNIDGVEIVSVISRRADQAAEVAAKYGARHSDAELFVPLDLDEVDAVLLCTPAQLAAEQAIDCSVRCEQGQAAIPLTDGSAEELESEAKDKENEDQVR